MNILKNPLFSCAVDNAPENLSLAQILAAIGQQKDIDLSALRKHQEVGFHVFLSQLATLAAHYHGSKKALTQENKIIQALEGLTSHAPTFWDLIAQPNQAAFMQIPVIDQSFEDAQVMVTPDQLDILITTKNHDIKYRSINFATPQDWVYSLVNLTTTIGYLGSGNFGIVRANGGFGSRNYATVRVNGSLSQTICREVEILLANRPKLVENFKYKDKDGIVFVSAIAWDGSTQLDMQSLDPHFIEAARIVRLSLHGDQIQARALPTKKERTTGKSLNGNTGDGWTPLQAKKDTFTAVSVAGNGFTYKKLIDLLFPQKGGQCAALQDLSIAPVDAKLELLFKVVAKGQGKTEGCHEYAIPVNPKIRSLFTQKRDFVAQVALDRVQQLAFFNRALWGAINEVIDNGDKVGAIFLPKFDAHMNTRFFEDLFKEVELEGDLEAMALVRQQWLDDTTAYGKTLIDLASSTMSRSRHSKYERLVNAHGRYIGSLYKNKVLVRKEKEIRKKEDA